jgi:hypothetical protein
MSLNFSHLTSSLGKVTVVLVTILEKVTAVCLLVGWNRTWDMQSHFIRIPIDHILFRSGTELVNNSLDTCNFKLLPSGGSDQRPLYVEFCSASESASRLRENPCQAYGRRLRTES